MADRWIEIERINKTLSHLVSGEIYSIVGLNCGCNLFWRDPIDCCLVSPSSSARTRIIAFVCGAAVDGG